jgi:hypothetical protein
VSVDSKESDKPTKEAQRPTEPRAAFRYDIAAVERMHQQCGSAIDDHDFEAVQYLAEHAATHWLAGRNECRRVLQGIKETSPYALAMRTVLDKNYMALLALFTRATETIAVPGMRQRIERARAELVAANTRSLG